jgi:hypothetical protein
VDGFLHLRTLTPREELSLALDMIELERVWVWVGVELDSLLLVAELVRAARPAAMAIREISTPRTVAQVARLMAHISTSQLTLAIAGWSLNDPSIRDTELVVRSTGPLCVRVEEM